MPDGTGVSNFGNVLIATEAHKTFTVKNSGDTALTEILVAFGEGQDFADFTLTTTPDSSLYVNGITTFTVRFAPTTIGPKAAVLHIGSNDADENPFDITLTGRALSPGADDDGDGVTNSAEILLSGSGFDPLADNAALVAQLRAAGLCRPADMQTLALGAPLLERNAATGNFVLRLELEQSPDLTKWTALTGTVDFTISPAGPAPQFFRVLGRKP